MASANGFSKFWALRPFFPWESSGEKSGPKTPIFLGFLVGRAGWSGVASANRFSKFWALGQKKVLKNPIVQTFSGDNSGDKCGPKTPWEGWSEVAGLYEGMSRNFGP